MDPCALFVFGITWRLTTTKSRSSPFIPGDYPLPDEKDLPKFPEGLSNPASYPQPPPLGLRRRSSWILGTYSISHSCGRGAAAS